MNSLYELFLRVLERGSISKVRNVLGISQPALSKRLQRLEDELHVKLFERTPSGMEPTVYGLALEKHARVICASIEAAQREMERLRNGVVSHVKFGASATVAAHILSEVIIKTLSGKKTFTVSIEVALPHLLVNMVREGKIEFAICTAPFQELGDDVRVERLFNDRYVAVIGPTHPLAKVKKPKLSDLHGQNWILPPRSYIRDWLDSEFILDGLPALNPMIETTSIEQTRRAAEVGTHVGFMARQVIDTQLREGALIPILTERLSLDRVVALVHRSQPALSAEAEIIVQSTVQAARHLGLAVHRA